MIHSPEHTPAPGAERLLGYVSYGVDVGEVFFDWPELYDVAPGVGTETIKSEVRRAFADTNYTPHFDEGGLWMLPGGTSGGGE